MGKIYRVGIFYDHHDRDRHGDLPVPDLLKRQKMEWDRKNFYFIFLYPPLDEDEEMVRQLIEKKNLMPLDDPRLHYNLVLQVFEETRSYGSSLQDYRSLSKPVTLGEGQTLASTHLTHLVMDEAEKERESHRTQEEIIAAQKGVPTGDRWRRAREAYLFCSASIEIRDSTPPKSSSSTTSSKWGEVVSTVENIFITTVTVAATAASIIGGLDVIERRWREKHTTHDTSSQRDISQTSESDIVAIRLRMTHGPDHEFEEWLTDPDRLKHYIDVFNEPSSLTQPLYAIFVQRNGKALKVDVSKGTQNNLQLNELLSYLHTDSAEK